MIGHIYLTGFMGAGKSTVGRLLARTWGRPLVDLDQEVARRLGLPVAEVFARLGEEAFRRAEAEALARVARRSRPLVVATGGGLPVREANRRLMRSTGRIVHLAAELETCRRRVGEAGAPARPLWRGEEELARLCQDRQAAYADCHLALATDRLSPAETAARITAELLGEESFTAELGGVRHPVVATGRGPEAAARLAGGRRVVILCDRNLARLHLEPYRRALGGAEVITFPPGESSKSLARLGRLYAALAEARLARDELLLALGGGVTTDLGAFLAATFKRGVPFVLAATSLLACVDAAIGGKAGVNLPAGKNLVGCFTRPQGVVLDLAALATLAPRHRLEGVVEAYKTGLVAASGLARLVEARREDLLRGELEALAAVAALSARVKARVVAEDFREAGRRRILNLGHTYGHALEALSGYRLSHGRAVAAGILVAAELSRRRGMIAPGLARRIAATLQPMLPRPRRWPGVAEVWEVMENDKKNQAGRVVFTLLAGEGRAVWVDDVSPPELAAALEAVRCDHG